MYDNMRGLCVETYFYDGRPYLNLKPAALFGRAPDDELWGITPNECAVRVRRQLL